MARAKAKHERRGLYDRDFNRLHQLDVVNLIDEIEDLSISRKHAATSNLVVILKHLLKHQLQPRRRSRSWLASITEHRRRLRKEFQHAPSLRGYAREQFEECYQGGRRQALIETGLAEDALPRAPAYTLEQVLDPEFLPE